MFTNFEVTLFQFLPLPNIFSLSSSKNRRGTAMRALVRNPDSGTEVDADLTPPYANAFYAPPPPKNLISYSFNIATPRRAADAAEKSPKTGAAAAENLSASTSAPDCYISNTTDTTESFTDTTESFTDINESFTEDDKDETLIAAVKRNPAIWNHMDKDYKSRDLKPQLWTLIASEVKQSVSWCKNRWTALRNEYTRKKRSTSGNLVEDHEEEESSSNFEEELDANTNSSTPASSRPVIKSERSDDKGYRKRKTEESEVDKELVDFPKRPKENQDEHYHFGLSIANQLRNMTPMMSSYVKLQIQNAIHISLYPNPHHQN
ncbi:Transcription factor Adf-1 [Folsomia candida]|uniref:Transcription factor Adf-1 n=1 Tax=Folsomia candida TaxID=158441 RepID=A0A226DFS8_FOLCA|nr:Transcription factor Adf-1 [Folsomia candida]